MAALLEMNTSPAEHEPAAQVKTPQRFTYASGSRPLDGYTIKRGVGRGGFGEVYFAVSDAGKEVALKLIRRNLEVELRGVTHCLNLKHPNLVALYDIRTDEHEDRWVVMEYVSGESLEDVIQRHPNGMPRELVMKWFEGICSAVDYLHDHGIVHRDLKPANIFIDDSTVKIGDYGLSKFISCSRRSGQTESVGTVHYMAPEIANGRYGREIDAYALGIILYEMLTGHVPFEGESVGEVLMKHLTAEPTLDAIDEPFRSVVRGAMAKDPERRINSAAQMVEMLSGVKRANTDTQPYPRPSSVSSERPSVAPAADAARSYSRPNPEKVWPKSYQQHDSALAFFHRDPEPIFASLKTAWSAIRRELKYEQWTILPRLGLAIILAMLLFGGAHVWIPMAIYFAMFYTAYLVVRVLVRSFTPDPHVILTPVSPQPTSQPFGQAEQRADNAAEATPRDANAAAGAFGPRPGRRVKLSRRANTQPPWRRRGTPTWRHAAYQQLATRSLRTRASSVIGSMVAAGVIAPAASLLVCMFLTPNLPTELTLWTAAVATLASWALMIPGQLAEGQMEDHAPLRFLQLLLGILVGMAAFAIAESLYLKLPASHDFAPAPNDTIASEMFNQRNEIVAAAYRSQGGVLMPLAMHAAFFATLFVVLRWWRLAEWTRSSRVSLWSVAWSAFIGWAVTWFWWYPQPLGLMLAAVIGLTVQLASPWLSPSRRRELAQAVV